MVSNSSAVQHVRFEGYGPGGAALLLECVTDDPQRLRAMLRHAFRAHGGFLGAEGAVSYLFDRVGWLRFSTVADRARLVAAAYAAGAESLSGTGEGAFEVRTDPEEFEAIRLALARQGWLPSAAGVGERAALTLPLAGAAAAHCRELLEALAQIEDVRCVYSNAEISDPRLARV